MRFGRYLAENLTPEWKRAYIDYKGCKKKIKVVAQRLGQVSAPEEDKEHKEDDSSDNDNDHGPSAPPPSARSPSTRSTSIKGRPTPPSGQTNPSRTPRASGRVNTSPLAISRFQSNPPPLDLGESSYSDSRGLPKRGVTFGSLPASEIDGGDDGGESSATGNGAGVNGDEEHHDSTISSDDDGKGSSSPQPIRRALLSSYLGRDEDADSSPKPTKSPRFGLTRSPKTPSGSPRITQSPSILKARKTLLSMTRPSPSISRTTTRSAETFDELYETLQPDEKDFFDFLDKELDKVENFFVARQDEALARARELREQLRDLAEHRKLYHEVYPEGKPALPGPVQRVLPGGGTGLHLRKHPQNLQQPDTGGADGGRPNLHVDTASKDVERAKRREELKTAMMNDKDHHTYNPERYQKYKGELRKAVMEFYRQLELIKNYRIMNLTGFRKALKKFEKVSNVHCLEMYTDERIARETFSKGETIEDLIKEVENMYSVHFEHGDAKKARERLRNQDEPSTTHYLTVFRSGLYLGIGTIAAIQALIQAVKPETHVLIPDWDGLLQVYAACALPVIFAILIELNLAAYVSARINYEFVMELSRPSLDHRAFLEIPAFLYLTLSICMYFSYNRVAADSVAPTTWPAGWLLFVVVFFLNPLPILRRRSRYWFLRVLFRVFTPGISRVEFIAFFFADELNSLIYTVQTILFLSCAYGKGWPVPIYTHCPSAATWPYILMSIIPGLSRFIQCIKRYLDSKLKIHLINALKYVFTMLQVSLFVVWRIRGTPIPDGSFVAFVIISIIYSSFASAFDLLVDWSLFRPHSALLRPDLAYSTRSLYYFAMVSNVMIRFVWIWYIPDRAYQTRLRSFFFALAEMLRRWQWNFYRVETEHLGNADAYRVTREIPLPYRRNDQDWAYEEQGADSAARGAKKRGNGVAIHLDKLKRRLTGDWGVKADSDANNSNTGGKPPAHQRLWEARTPGGVLRSRSRSLVDSPQEV